MRACKALALFLLISLAAIFLHASPQSLSQPSRLPVHCFGAQNNCMYPVVLPGSTGIIVTRRSEGAALTDSLGNVWTQDQCTTFDNGDCAFSTHFNVPYPVQNVKVTFPAGTGQDVYLFVYEGLWNFSGGGYGTYDQQNSAVGCVNGQGCAYDWTLPVATDSGALLIAWSNPNTYGAGVARPGLGFNIEASDGTFAVEDMIAPVEGVYIGSLTWKNADGSDGGGSHWLMGLAAYTRQK